MIRRAELRGALHDSYYSLLGRLWRWGVRRCAQSIDDALLHSPTLVLAPHPDDESLGCGGFVALKRRSDVPVSIVVATDGAAVVSGEDGTRSQLAAVRAAEVVSAAAELGVAREDVHMLGFHDGQSHSVVEALAAAIGPYVPSDGVILVPAAEHHPDHAALNQALRAWLDRETSSRVTVIQYLVHSWVNGPVVPEPRQGAANLRRTVLAVNALRHHPSLRVDIAPVLGMKEKAIAAHASQHRVEEHGRVQLPPDFTAHFTSRFEYYLPWPASETT